MVPVSTRAGLPGSARTACRSWPVRRGGGVEVPCSCDVRRATVVCGRCLPWFGRMRAECDGGTFGHCSEGTGTAMAVQLQADAVAAQATATLDGAIVEARAVDKRYDTGELQVHALRERRHVGPARRDGRDHGPERLRQDDAPELPLRPRRDRRRRGADRGRRAWPACPTTSARTTARAAWASSSSSTT